MILSTTDPRVQSTTNAHRLRKKAKLALILNKISEVEKIVADEEALEKEITHILEHYKDADRDRVRAHADNVLTNEKVFQFLENQ